MTPFHRKPSLRLTPLCRATALALSLFPALGAAQTPSAMDFVDAEFKASGALELIRAQYAYQKGYTGSGVVIAIVDSGLDLNHPEFAGRVSPFLGNYVPGFGDTDVSDVDEDGEIEGHGTHVAGLAAAARDGTGMHGVAYRATVLPLRTNFEPEQLTQAYQRAIEAGAKVLNGSYGPSERPPLYIQDDEGEWQLNPTYQQMDYQVVFIDELKSDYAVAKQAADADIVLVYAAGNEFREQPIASLQPDGAGALPFITPENTRAGQLYRFIEADVGSELDPRTWRYIDPTAPEVVALDFSDLEGGLLVVVATDRLGAISNYSNRCGAAQRWCLAAPGGGSETEGFPGPLSELYSTLPYSDYGYEAGTSMAAPVTSGAAAVLREAFPYMSARQIIELILTTADDSGPLWSDRATYGHGMLDLGKAINGPAVFGESGFPNVFDVNLRDHDSVWSNRISGSGGLRKAGVGTLTMLADNSYTGATDIVEGKFVVNGSIARSSMLTVQQLATLSGTGTVGKTEMYGTAAPGNSIGTLTVDGDYTQYPGSRLEIELDDAGTADRLLVNGDVNLLGGELVVDADAGRHLGLRYPIIEANGELLGNLDDTALSGLFIDMRTYARPGALDLAIERNATPFALYAQSSNQAAVAQAMDSQGYGGAAFRAIASIEDPQGLPGLYDSLSGEIYASTRTALMDVSDSLRRVVGLRNRDAWGMEQRVSASGDHVVWGGVLGSRGQASGHGAHDLDRSVTGLLLGADTAVGRDSRVGLAVAYTDIRIDDDYGNRVDGDGYHLTAYGDVDMGAWALRGGVMHSWYDMSAKRQLAWGPPMSSRSEPDARALQLFGELAYGWQWGEVEMEPYVGLSHMRLRQSSFAEDHETFGVYGDGQTDTLTFSTLGLRAALNVGSDKGRDWRITAGIGWRHAWGAVEAERDLRFATGRSYTVVGTPVSRNAMIADVGVDLRIARHARVGLSYAGQLGSDGREHGLRASVQWAF